MSATDVLSAINGQNIQTAAGSLGAAPAVAGQALTVPVNGESRFSTPEQFENIILRSNSNGTTVRLKDVARVQLAPYSYGFMSLYNGKPVAGIGLQLLPGANALQVAKAVRARMDQLQQSFPEGVTWFTPYDSTTFVNISIDEVVKTLFEAIVLVFLVMLPVPAESARHADPDPGDAGSTARYLCRTLRRRILDQHPHPARPWCLPSASWWMTPSW